MNLERLLAQRSDLWRGQAVPPTLSPGISSGFAELDARLCGRGWPRGARTSNKRERSRPRAARAGDQGLQSGSCSAVLIWGGKWQPAGLRRLQLAAAQGESLALLFRDPEAAGQAVPAALRLGVRPVPQGLRVEILKQRGGRPGGVVVLHP